MVKKPGRRQRLRYAFDNTLSTGPGALIAWLALATILIVALAFVTDLLAGGTSGDLTATQVFWNFLFQALVPNPPGSFSAPIQFLVVMLVVTLFSLAMVSILIGLLSAAIANRVETLRRGRSLVVEHDHTVILGWSTQIYAIISELQVANASRRHTAIAILGDRDQVEMEDDIRHRVKPARHTRVVCRRGDPIEYADLDLVSPQTSRSIIVLPADDEPYPDASVLKTVLAITKAPDRRPEPYRIVAFVRHAGNMEAAQLLGRHEVTYVQSGDVIARIIAQTCRQAGLSAVYSELLDYEGDEIYFQEEPALVGRTFGEALLAYEDSAVMGIFTAGKQVLLGPPPTTVIQPGDQIIAISEDDTTVRLRPAGGPPPAIQEEAILTAGLHHLAPERTLILGWNWRGATVIRQLDAYVVPGSSLTVVAQHDTAAAEIQALSRELANLAITYLDQDISKRATLMGLGVETYDHVVVLCNSDAMDAQRADSLSLLVLLHLRHLAELNGAHFSLVSEMLDARNRQLAESTRADDFIVSNQLISLLLAQISENPEFNTIFNDLLDPSGNEIYLKPGCNYIQPGAPVNFYTVVEAACRRGEVALGYRIKARAAEKGQAEGVVLNPHKSDLITFAPEDRVIVLAEA